MDDPDSKMLYLDDILNCDKENHSQNIFPSYKTPCEEKALESESCFP
jgi:hypothetical protein